MVNGKVRRAVAAYAEDNDVEVKILDNSAYDDSIIGVTPDGRLIYSYDKMVVEYMNDNDCTMEDAVEWIEYNTVRALPYFGEGAPIISCSLEKYEAE